MIPHVLLVATGAEVHTALEARKLLAADGTTSRVVSLPCWELFEEQPQSYRDEVLPPGIEARVCVEAGASLGWERFAGARRRDRRARPLRRLGTGHDGARTPGIHASPDRR